MLPFDIQLTTGKELYFSQMSDTRLQGAHLTDMHVCSRKFLKKTMS
jgi:hypothetical protein